MHGTFKKGLLLGGMVGAAAALGAVMASPHGKAWSEDTGADLRRLSRQVRRRLSKLQQVTKEKFDDIVCTVVDEYADKKELAVDLKDALVDALRGAWRDAEAREGGE